MDCVGKYYFLDGAVLPAGIGDEPGTGEVAFYEVIRTRRGVPLFFHDHMRRLRDGISTRYELHGDIADEVRYGLNALIASELYEEINVRVTVTFTGQDHSMHICYLPSFYPSPETVREGVPLILFHAERFNPGVKMLNKRLRLTVNEELARRNAYEALLVNREGFITEGSRSNIFFITEDGVIHTAPDGMVLPGITRRYVMEIIRSEGIPMVADAVKQDGISRFRSAFLTGTSPMVLPVRSIENQIFNPANQIALRLRELYSALAENSIRAYLDGNEAE
jgi:branched-chain amino acid aminotransferase